MPDKKYPKIDWQLKPTASAAELKVPNVPLVSSLKKYTAQLRKVSFKYPSDWTVKPMVGVESDGVKRESVKLCNSSGGVAATFTLTEPGKYVYCNPGNHQAEHEIAVVTAKPVVIPGWQHPVVYTVIIVAWPNGTFYVAHGLRSKHPLYDHVHTFISTQDEVPLLLSEPAQPLDPNIGFLAFMEGRWGFKTKAEALAYLKSPTYKAIRSCMLTTSFV